MKEAKDQAEMYLDLMGHDINNLNLVGMGYLEMALDLLRTRGSISIGDKQLLDKAMETQVTSSRLIDNVRKIQRSMEGSLKYQVVNLCEVLSGLKEYYSQVPNRDVTIGLSTPDYCFVSANELIRDVFSNLIDNAIKHSDPRKHLKIDMYIKDVTIEGNDFYEVSIADNGPGYPDELKSKLFTRFQRGTTKAIGHGLGLYLVRTLVEGFGGHVLVEDRVKGDYHSGSRFVVLLPTTNDPSA